MACCKKMKDEKHSKHSCGNCEYVTRAFYSTACELCYGGCGSKCGFKAKKQDNA